MQVIIRLISLMLAMLMILASSAATQAIEPNPHELAALAPSLDSGNHSCRSLDVGGIIGDEKGVGSRMRFRTIYRAPDKFSFLLSDVNDDTPLVFYANKEMFVYDPIEPAVYYSNTSGFVLELSDKNESVNFLCYYSLKTSERPRVAIDLHSILARVSTPKNDLAMGRATRIGDRKYLLGYQDNNSYKMDFFINMSNKCKYNDARFSWNGTTILNIDRIAVDDIIDENMFEFPSKRYLTQNLSFKDQSKLEGPEQLRDLGNIVARAFMIRSFVNQNEGAEAPKIPGIQNLNWDHVRSNDRKYSRSLRDLIPRGYGLGSRR